MKTTITYYVPGKRHKLEAIGKDMLKYCGVRSDLRDGRLRVVIENSTQQATLQEVCCEQHCRYFQENEWLKRGRSPKGGKRKR